MGPGLVSKELIRQIKERTDITDVVSGYVSLARAGQNLKGLCPFHAEKTPSFVVSPSRQVFHCYGCGVGGDVFAFLMKRENFEFVESVRELGRRAGIEVSLSTAQPGSREEFDRERLWQANESAAAWFRTTLGHAEHGKGAREYLASRGITPETAECFGLGLSLAAWDGLLRALTQKGFTPAELEAAGLVVAKDRTDRRQGEAQSYYDRFRGRLMFPIHDLRGRVVAFGGRVLGDGLPKYLNSPESPVFKKGSALYGLERAREAAWQAKALVVVEGYFDAVALYQSGVKNVVATLGTALTPEHVKALRRFASKVSLIFDADPAGVGAAVRTLDVFKDSGIGVRVVSLPAGDDPDTYVRRHGADVFRELEARAPSLVEFAVAHSLRSAASGVMEDRIRSVDDILRILQKTQNRIEKEECLRLVSEQLGINQSVLIARYPEVSERDVRRGKPDRSPSGTPPRRFPGRPDERELIRFLLQGRLNASQIRELGGEAFSVPAYSRIVESAQRHLDADGRVQVHDVLDEMVGDPECGPIATGLSLADDNIDDLEEYIRGCFETFQRKRRELQLSELIAKLRVAEREGRLEEADRLNAQVNELRMDKAVRAPSTV